MSAGYQEGPARATRKDGKDFLPPDYNAEGTNGIVIPLNSPVFKQRKKGPSVGKFAKMERHFFAHMNPAEFKTFATMLLLGLRKRGCHVITNEDVQKWSGLSKRTIERAQAGLQRKGFLKRHKSRRSAARSGKRSPRPETFSLIVKTETYSLGSISRVKMTHETRFLASK